jgi:hypothetical protein
MQKCWKLIALALALLVDASVAATNQEQSRVVAKPWAQSRRLAISGMFCALFCIGNFLTLLRGNYVAGLELCLANLLFFGGLV